MNKKGLIAVIIIVVLVVIGYLVWGKGSNTASNPAMGTDTTDTTGTTATLPAGVTKDSFAPVTKSTVDTSLIGRLKSVSVAAAETGSRVALVDGKAQFSTEDGKGTITLGDIAVSKTVGSTGYAVATLGVTSGSSAAAQYAVLFQDNNGTLSDSSYALLGIGAQVTGLRADEVTGGLIVTVNYTVSGKAKTKILSVDNGAFNSAKEINF